MPGSSATTRQMILSLKCTSFHVHSGCDRMVKPVIVTACAFWLLVLCAVEAQNGRSPVEDAFLANGIVPDVVDVAPVNQIDISYADGSVVALGNELTPEQAAPVPSTTNWPVEAGKYYTLIMVDPDAPSRPQPTSAEILHRLVVNIPGNDIAQGEELMAYAGPNPPAGSGLHRYITMTYEHPQGVIQFDPIPSRSRFSTRNFTVAYNLGQPLAGNFFQAQRF